MKKALLAILAGALLLPPSLGAESFASWSAKAEKAARAKDYDAAAEAYTNALRLWGKRDGKKARALILAARAGIYERKEDWKLVIEDLSAAQSLEPKNATFLHRRGQARLALGEASKAIDDFDKAIALKLTFREAYFDRARAYEAQGDPKFAKEDYKYACKLGFKKACHPHEPDAEPEAKAPKHKRARKASAPPFDFAVCIKLIDDCGEGGGSYDKCVSEAKVCGPDEAAACCPAACVKDFDAALSQGKSQAQAYRAVFSPESACAKK